MSSLLPAVIIPASIPSPSQGVWHLGPVPLRAYAICILLGIFAGYWLGRKRWVARGGSAEVLADVIMWSIPFGLVGARLYHVITDAELYFGEGKNPVDALKIWQGGLGVWGAVALGAVGAWIACRRHKVSFLAVADAMAPGIALAQVIGRFGNYFNQELYGRATDLPWALEIDTKDSAGNVIGQTLHHPTFLYEAIWNLGVVALVILADRRFKLGHGRAFALYVAGYTAGRAWVENLRIDTVNEFAGLRLNVWVSIILFILAVAYFIWSARTHPGQEDLTTSTPSDTDPAAASASPDSASDSSGDSEAAPDPDEKPEDATPEAADKNAKDEAPAEPAQTSTADASASTSSDGSRD